MIGRVTGVERRAAAPKAMHVGAILRTPVHCTRPLLIWALSAKTHLGSGIFRHPFKGPTLRCYHISMTCVHGSALLSRSQPVPPKAIIRTAWLRGLGPAASRVTSPRQPISTQGMVVCSAAGGGRKKKTSAETVVTESSSISSVEDGSASEAVALTVPKKRRSKKSNEPGTAPGGEISSTGIDGPEELSTAPTRTRYAKGDISTDGCHEALLTSRVSWETITNRSSGPKDQQRLQQQKSSSHLAEPLGSPLAPPSIWPAST